MSKPLITLLLLIAFSFRPSFSQTGSISGTVSDSLTGQPVVNLTVFIPNTTKGINTDQNGKYHLDQVSPGDYVLMFRHMSYPSVTRQITIEPGKNLVLNLVIAEKSQKLREVVVVGQLPDRRMAYHLFQQFFLGDDNGKYCELENPSALSFFFDGSTLKATAKEPLIISNHHLGYRITFFLDYFKCTDYRNPEFRYDLSGNFGYSGYALFEDRASAMPLRAMIWKFNRSGEFRGSLRQFLACLYRDKLNENHYFVRRAWHGPVEIQLAEVRSNAMTKIRMARADSISSWNQSTGKPEPLFYFYDEEYTFSTTEVSQGSEPDRKRLSTDALLLVFRDYKGTKTINDDFISTLRIPKCGITFDKDGNFWVPQGDLQWINLDNTLQIKRLLPYDYMTKIDETTR